MWILLVLTSMVLIGYGIWHAGWHIWLPAPAQQEQVWVGNRYIFAGCALSLATAVWSGARNNRILVTICVGLPGALVGWATMDSPYDLKRFVAVVVSYPMALAAVVEVISARPPAAGLTTRGIVVGFQQRSTRSSIRRRNGGPWAKT